MNDVNRELCSDKLNDLTHKEIRDILMELVFPYFDKSELIDMIEKEFQACDWDWFFEEYVMENGPQEIEKED